MELNEFISELGRPVVATMLNVSVEMVRKWSVGVPVSAGKVLPLAKASDYRVTPHKLRPDIYPHPHDGLPEHLRLSIEDAA